MAYVDGFDYDFFLSYAHVDDEPVPLAPTEDRWVSNFYEVLNHFLRLELGGTIYAPWKDGKIPLHRALEVELRETVSRSAVLLVLLSPGYVQSSWCAKELSGFTQSRGEAPPFVIIVEKQPVEILPPGLPDNLRFRFYDNNTMICYGHPVLKPDPETFFAKVLELSRFIKQALDDLKNNPGAKSPAPTSEAPSCQSHNINVPRDFSRNEHHPYAVGLSDQPVPSIAQPPEQKLVFLAQTDMEKERDAVRDFLHQRGAHVVPQRDYPQDPEDFRAAATRDLQKAQVFVQLLSGNRGPRPAGLEQGYAKLQWELAKANADLPILQWRSSSLDVSDVTDPHTRELLNEPTVIAESMLTFQQEILKTLQQKPKPPLNTKGKLVVFINGDVSDLEFANRIAKIAKKNGAKKVWLPTLNRDPELFAKDIKTKYQTSHGVALIYGATSDVWVNGQVGLFWTWTGETERSLPLDVFSGPPPDGKLPLGFDDDDVKIHDCCRDDPATLEAAVCDFLERVRANV